MQCTCCQHAVPACLEMSGDVRDGWVRDCSALPCVAVSWLSQVMVCCQVGTCMTQFHRIELWWSVTVSSSILHIFSSNPYFSQCKIVQIELFLDVQHLQHDWTLSRPASHSRELQCGSLLSEQGGTWDGVHDVRCKLNLLAGSLVTVAYRFIRSSVGVKMELKSEMDRDSASSAESSEWEWKMD